MVAWREKQSRRERGATTWLRGEREICNEGGSIGGGGVADDVVSVWRWWVDSDVAVGGWLHRGGIKEEGDRGERGGKRLEGRR